MNLAYVEKTVGPAIRSEFGFHEFEIENCKLTLQTGEQGRSVEQIQLELTPECHASTTGLFTAEAIRKLSDLTFADYATLLDSSFFTSDCLTSCGNASDPVVSLGNPGSRSNQDIKIAVNRAIVSDDFMEAVGKWTSLMA